MKLKGADRLRENRICQEGFMECPRSPGIFGGGILPRKIAAVNRPWPHIHGGGFAEDVSKGRRVSRLKGLAPGIIGASQTG